MMVSFSFLFSAVNLQTASKDELMCFKGIGAKKADAILEYRKSNTLNSADDLLAIKGFGKGMISNIKADIKTAKCGGKKTTASTKTASKSSTKKKSVSDDKASTSLVSDEKKK